MTEDTQCETMGLQAPATSPPMSPLHRPMPVPSPMNHQSPMLKRKHDLVEDDDDVSMSVTTGSGFKKICVEVVCGSGTHVNGNEVNDSVQLHHRHHHGSNSDEDLEDYSDDGSNTSSDDDRSSNGMEDSIMVTSSNESNCEDNKENHINDNKLTKGELESILAKTLLNTATLSPSPPGTTENSVTGLTIPSAQTTTTGVTETMPKNDNESPKVIVEHKPLPSIYDLQQMSAACDTLDDNSITSVATLTSSVNNINSSTAETNKFSSSREKENDSGVSDDEEDEDDEVSDLDGESGDEDEEEDDDEPSPSPIFDPVLRGTPAKPLLPSPPKAIYGNGNDRFWSNNGSQNHSNHNSAYNGNQQQQQQQQGQQQAQQPSVTFQFLDQSTQRIECAENGKSYLQLGTMNAMSHHLPVTPVIQPKPNMVYRRPIPPFRNHMVSSAINSTGSTNAAPAVPRPVCDHSNCLQKKNSFCYQSQRSRMLNLSLSKLHMARQSHDGSLRRSVLICNMLRYIEDETDREAMHETSQYSHSQGAPMETNGDPSHHYWPPTSNMNQPPPPQQPQPQLSQQQQQQQQQVQSQQQAQVAPPPSGISSSVATSGISAVVTSEAPMGYNMGNPAVGAAPSGGLPGQQQQQLNQSAMVGGNPNGPNMDPYETTLKDFNSAFRSTPYSSPAHPGSDMDSGLGDVDMDRGINWSSVLSLTSGSQSELDPLNNNTFATEAWPNTANTPTTLSGSVQQHPTTLTDISSSTVSTTQLQSSRPSSPVLSEYCTTTSSITCTTSTTNTVNGTSHHHFDDIGWKLSADDVLKAFPNDENLFAVAGP